MSEDFLIDLQIAILSKDGRFVTSEIYQNSEGYTSREFHDCVLEMEDDRFLIRSDAGDHRVTTLGKERLALLLKKKENADLTLQLGKWQTKVFWPAIVLGIVGGIYSVVRMIERVQMLQILEE